MCRFLLCFSFAPLNRCCVPLSRRKFGYVDFSSEEDMQKAMELNGKKVMGMELKLDMPRSKETTQEDKKGKAPPPSPFHGAKILEMTPQTLYFLACMSCSVLRRVMYGGK